MRKLAIFIVGTALAAVFGLSGLAQAADSTVPGDFATIQAAIDDVGTVAGDTITLMAAGHVESNIQVTKSVTIAGSGGATLDPGAGQIGIRPLADNVTIRDLVIQDCSQAIRFEDAGNTIDGTTLLRVTMLNCTSRGIEVHNATTVTNLLVEDSTFDRTVTGLRVSSSGHLNDSVFRNSTFTRLNIGIYEANDGGTSTMDGLLVTGCTFEDISLTWGTQSTAIFLEEIQNAVIEDNTFIDNRRDIQIFKWYQASVPVSNVIIRNNTMTGTTDSVFAIFNREHTTGRTTFDGVTFTGNTATIDPSLADNGGAVFAGAFSGAAFDIDGGLGWETVEVSCNTFLKAHKGEGVRFFLPPLAGASLNVKNNWWGTSSFGQVKQLMEIPSITDFTPFLTSPPDPDCGSPIDIKPGSFPNSVNINSKGTIPVAILSSITFDAGNVDPSSLTFGPTGNEASADSCSVEDVNDDGLDDLVCHFNVQDTGFACGDTEGVLTGELFDATPIEETGPVKIVPCN